MSARSRAAAGLAAIVLIPLGAAADPVPAPEPTVPHAAPASGPTVVPLPSAEVRVAPHGKARVALLARGENAFVGRLEIDPGAKVPVHRDATEEYVHVLAGTGTVTIDGVSTAVGPGDTIYMPAGAEVTYANGPDKSVVIQVFAGPKPADRYQKWTGPKVNEPKAP